MHGDFPERIVCLTEETTEALYLLGEDARLDPALGGTPALNSGHQPVLRLAVFLRGQTNDVGRQLRGRRLLVPAQ